MSAPGHHPLPPADLPARKLPITRYRGGWYRVHRVAHGPLHFGRAARHRFDAPGGAFGVLYVARRPRGAFIETFGHDTGIRVLDARELAARALTRVEPARPLRLVALTGEGLARLGADSELLSGSYALSQRWARALHDHPATPDGIAYRARHDPSQVCAALFERAAPVLTPPPRGAFADAALAPLLAELLDTYDFGLV